MCCRGEMGWQVDYNSVHVGSVALHVRSIVALNVLHDFISNYIFSVLSKKQQHNYCYYMYRKATSA